MPSAGPRTSRRSRARRIWISRKTSSPTPPRRRRPPSSSRRRMPRRPRKKPQRPRTSSSSRPVSVALTGGIGAGKSVALEAFARHGAATRSSDDIVHELLRDDPEVRRALAERFGPEVIGEAGADRAAIARIVFHDRAELDWLEQLLHPRVIQEQYRWRQELAA